MPRRSRDEVRFVFDEDNRGIGLSLARMRTDMACVGEEPVADELPLGIKDPRWIPVAGRNGWIAITKNYRIRTQPVEAQLAIDHRLVAVCLFPANERASRWELSGLLFRHWRRVEELDPSAGPTWLELGDERAIVRDFEPGMSNRRLRRARRGG